MKRLLQWIKVLLIIVLVLSAIVLGAVFESENQTAIAPVLLGHTLPSLSVGVYLCLTLALGVLIGGALSYARTRWRIHTLNQANRRQAKALNKLDTARESR